MYRNGLYSINMLWPGQYCMFVQCKKQNKKQPPQQQRQQRRGGIEGGGVCKTAVKPRIEDQTLR